MKYYSANKVNKKTINPCKIWMNLKIITQRIQAYIYIYIYTHTHTYSYIIHDFIYINI